MQSHPIPSLGPEDVVDAALSILGEQGLDAVTMRSVAACLDVKTPSVYWHIESKEALLERIFDRLCGEVELPGAGPWDEQLRQLAREIRRVFAAHGDSSRLAVGRFPIGANGVQITEFVLATLRRAGLNDSEIADAAYLYFSYVSSFAHRETILPAYTAGEDRVGALKEVEHRLQTMDQDAYPNVARCAAALVGPGLDRRFEFGLDQILYGVGRGAATEPPATLPRAAPRRAAKRD